MITVSRNAEDAADSRRQLSHLIPHQFRARPSLLSP